MVIYRLRIVKGNRRFEDRIPTSARFEQMARHSENTTEIHQFLSPLQFLLFQQISVVTVLVGVPQIKYKVVVN